MFRLKNSVSIYTVLLLVLIITLSANSNITYHGEPELIVVQNVGIPVGIPASLTPHGPVIINNNRDFDNQGWPGYGNSTHPYIIEDLNITAVGVCINIADTTAFFEVRDCVISSAGGSWDVGIHLYNVTNGIVRNSTLDYHDRGIYLERSYNCTMINNAVSSCSYGFFLLLSNSCIYESNTASNNENYGFMSYYSNNCTLTNNVASNNSVGFSLYDSSDCILMNNTSSNNGRTGFRMYLSDNCIVSKNIVSYNGEIGIHLGSGCNHNAFFLNKLGNNTQFNARDGGWSNSWDDGVSSGNYWIDYNGTGTYLIPGSAGSVDNYPFVWGTENSTTATTTTTTDETGDTTLILILLGIGLVGMVIVVAVVPKMRKR